MALQLVFISDTHSRHWEMALPGGDVLIHCGDFCAQGGLPDAEDFAAFMAAQNFRHKIVIAGNHDWCFEDERRKQAQALLENRGIVYLNDSAVEIDGIRFWGSPVQPVFHQWAFNRRRGEEIDRHWQMIPDDTDVLLTHGPAFGILDTCIDGRQVGCEDLLRALQRVRPAVHACGHIHESYGSTRQGDTLCLNASNLDVAYRLSNAPLVVEIGRDGEGTVNASLLTVQAEETI